MKISTVKVLIQAPSFD